MPEHSTDIQNLLEVLSVHEYSVRKYRARAESRDFEGDSRRAMDSHRIAYESRVKADEAVARLEKLLGPDDGPGWGAIEYLKLAWRHGEMLRRISAEQASFEDACFAMRHPRWTKESERFRAALARWQGTPELDAMAPKYLPIYEGWVD